VKWLARIGVGLLAIVAAVLLMFYLVTGTDRGGKWLASKALTLSRNALPFNLYVGSIRANGLGHWTLRNVRGTELESDKQFFSAYEVDVDLNWRAYASERRIDILKATIDSLNVNLWFDTTGVFHPVFPGADTTRKEPEGSRKPLPLAIRELESQQIAISFDDRGQERTVKLYDADLKGSGMGDEWKGGIEGWLSLRLREATRTLNGQVTLAMDVVDGNLELKRLLWITPAGRLDGKGNWALAQGSLTAAVEGEVNLDTLSVILPAADRLSGLASYQFEVTRGARDLLGRLAFDLQGMLLDSLEIRDLSGIVAAKGQFEGPLTPVDSLRGDVTFHIDDFQGSQGLSGTVNGEAHLNRSLLVLSANGAGIDLAARGTVLGKDAPNVNFNAFVRDIDRFTGGKGAIEGDVRLAGKLTGAWNDPDIRATYTVPLLTLQKIRDQDVHGALTYRDSTVTFTLRTARGITGEGRAVLPRTPPGVASTWQIRATLSALDFPLADIEPLLPPGFIAWWPEGRADLTAELHGTLDNPRGTIHMVGEDLRVKNYEVGVLDLTGQIAPGVVRFSGNLTPAIGRGEMFVEASLPLERRTGFSGFSQREPMSARLMFNDLVFEAARLDSATLDTLPRYVNVTGLATLSMIPDVANSQRVHLDLDTLVIRSRRARLQSDGPILFDLAGRSFSLDSTRIELWRNNPDTLAGVVQGSLHYDGNRVFSGGFVAGPIPMELVAELLPGSPEYGGTITARVAPAGSLGDLDLHGEIDWIDPSTPQFTFDRIRSRFRYLGQEIVIDSLIASADTSGAVGSGVVHLGQNGAPARLELDFRTENFSLASLPVPPASFRTLTGSLDGWVRIRGTTAEMLMTGEFDLADGALQMGPMLAPIRGVTAHIRLDGSTVLIDTLRSEYDNGSASMSGTFTLAAGDNYGYDMSGRLDGLPLFLEPGIQVRLTGPISLEGVTDRAQVSGNFRVTEGRYVERFDLQKILMRREIVAVRSERTRRLLDGMNLNVRVNAESEDFKVDNNLAVIPMRLDLLIFGTALDWRVAGTAEADADGNGQIFYLDREFDVEQLAAVFDDPRRPDPRIDLAATYSTRDEDEELGTGDEYDITLSFNGRASEFRPTLTSDPPLAQPDIVALLTLGVPVAGLGIGSGGSGRAGDVFLSRARDLTTRGVLQLAGRRAADFVGVSRVQFRTIEGDIDHTEVTVGQDFGKDVSVNTTTEITDPGVPKLEINWRLTRRFSLRTIGSQVGESSLDFRYAFRFW
jgi:hypothetical protein